MKISEMITSLSIILHERGDLPIVCNWTETDDEGEEYEIEEEPVIYPTFDKVWISY